MQEEKLSSVAKNTAMVFTGERYVPEMEGDIALEHWHRYTMAQEIIQGRTVLDIACGEGYGSAFLAGLARYVIGADMSREVVCHASRRYRRDNLKFITGNCKDIPLRDSSVEVIVSFETIEHLAEHAAVLTEFRRILRPGGVVVVSSPDRYEYSVASGHSNPFHVKELYRHEFQQLMASHFRNVALFGQRVIYGSAILLERGVSSMVSYSWDNAEQGRAVRIPRPLYLIAVASDAELPPVSSGIFEQAIDRSQVVHSWKRVVAEREGQIVGLREAVAERDEQVVSLTQAVAERDGQVASLTQAVAERDEQVVSLTQAVADREAKTVILRQALTGLEAQVVQKEQTIRDVSAQMAVITSSTGWGLLQVLWRIRLWIAPRGSLRERLLRLGMRALRALKPKNFMRLFRKNDRTIEPSTEPERSASVHGDSDTAALLGRGLSESSNAYRQDGINSEEKSLEDCTSAPSAPMTRTRNERLFLARRIKQVARRVLPPAWRDYLRPLRRHVTNPLPPGLSEHPGEKFSLPCTDSFGTPTSYDVICFPIIEWDHRFQRPQQLMTLFARDGHRVFYLNLTFHDRGAGVEWRPVTERIFQVRLPGPTNLNRFFESLPPDGTSRCLTALDEFCAESGIRDAICMVQLPFWTPLALGLRERYGWKVIFDCMDEHEGLTILQPEMLQDEFELARQADLVVVSAQKLWDKHADQASRRLLLPNGTDFDHFSRPTDEHGLAALPRPIIGYYGAIMQWFDAEMVIGAAKARPDWSFVLIGNADTPSVERLRRLPNVHLLGEKPYSRLPGYLHQFDVCLIPFKLTPIIQSTNPVKFYEYLSAGKPVVAVPMPELLPYQDLFYAARDAQEVVAEVERALREDNPSRAAVRIDWARHQTWRARYQRLVASIEEVHGLVTIVIVSYQNLEKMQMCLESIIERTHYPRYEVIVVDNGSTSEVVRYLESMSQRIPRLRVVFNQENFGFARANNIGLRAMSEDSQYIVLLNNDTVVTRGWLTALTRWLRHPEVGLVGPVTCRSGAANEAAIPADYCDLGELESFSRGWTCEHHGVAFDIPMLAMFCVAMRREVYEQVGPLDEQFAVGMFEDDDYSLRVRNKAYRVICAEDVFIHHFGRASFSQLESNEYRRIFDENRRRFEAKWNIKWQLPSGR